jgi:hypothetical protein
MRDIKDLLPDLTGARGIIGIAPNIALFHLTQAAIELCERAPVWVETLLIDQQQGLTEYPLDLFEGARVIQVQSVKSECCGLVPNRNLSCACSCGGFRVEGNNLIVSAPNQDVDLGFVVKVHCAPVRDYCQIPENIYQEWAETIADGAASRCFMMPKTDWFSAGLASVYARKFEAALGRALIRTKLGRTPGPLMMRGSFF